jgi:hypothetical protein
MKQDVKTPALVFLTGIFITCLVISPFALDQNITIRYLTCAITLTLVNFLFFQKEISDQIGFEVPVFFYFLFICWNLASNAWANTLSESLYSSGREMLGFIIFLTFLSMLRLDEEAMKRGLHILSAVLAAIIIFIAAFQFIQAGNITHEATYSVRALSGHKNLLASFLFLNLFFIVDGIQNNSEKLKVALLVMAVLSIITIHLLQSKAVYVALLTCLLVYTMRSFIIKRDSGNGNKQIIIWTCITLATLYFILPYCVSWLLSPERTTLHKSIFFSVC